MDTFIAAGSASDLLGLPTQRKTFVIKSGRHLNRVVILYASSAAVISLTWADPPYDGFSDPVSVVTDAADSPFDAFMDEAGDIYVAYTITGALHLGFVLLTCGVDGWSAETPVTVYNGGESYHPSIRRLSSEYLWITYTRVAAGSRYISAKVSADDGITWGTTSDPGDTLTAGSASAYGTMTEAGDYQYVFYSDGGVKIAYRRKMNAGAVWNSEVTLASGSGYDERLCAAVSEDARVGVAYADGDGLRFREYSGSTWSGEYTVYDGQAGSPAVSYQGGAAFVLFSRGYGSNMNLVMYSRKVETSFQSPSPLDGRKSYLQKLLVYDASAGTYQDKTGEASSTETADVKHSASGALVSAVNDAVFFGMHEPFHFLSIVLSPAGIGGEVTWKYWDGQAWKAFTPVAGAWHFSAGEKGLLLWDDYRSIPADWQKKPVQGDSLYWITAAVTSAFSTAPLGTQITAISNLQALSVGV